VIEFSSKVTSKGGIEVRRIGDPLFLWAKIGVSSSNIIDELWRMGIKSEFTSRINELKGKMERIVNNS